MDELESKLKCFFGSGRSRGLFIFGNFMHSDLKESDLIFRSVLVNLQEQKILTFASAL